LPNRAKNNAWLYSPWGDTVTVYSDITWSSSTKLGDYPVGTDVILLSTGQYCRIRINGIEGLVNYYELQTRLPELVGNIN